jgi:hypothetical protein
VSASKSGEEVAIALGRELAASESDSVAGWLSIVGVLRGSPLADRGFEPDLCWLMQLSLGVEGFDLEGARSMRTARAPGLRLVALAPTRPRHHADRGPVVG